MGYTPSNTPDQVRYDRLMERKKRRLDVDSSSATDGGDAVDVDTGVACQATVDMMESTCQTNESPDITGELDKVKEEYTLIQQKYKKVKEEYEHLQYKYERTSLSEESLRGNEQKLKFYTGMYFLII